MKSTSPSPGNAGPNPVDAKHYLDWMKKTQPVLSHPEMTDDATDLGHMLSQPEILGSFWPDWNPRTGARGANPGISAKALLIIASTLGMSAHFKDNYKWLSYSPIRQVFERVEETSARAKGRAPNPFEVQTCPQVLRQARKIVHHVPAHAVATNIQMLKSMHALHPSSCVRLGIDGTPAKAWCLQVGNRSEQEEAWIRRNAPKAGPRGPFEKGGVVSMPFWRGWNLVVVTDLATGLPLIWRLIDANTKEADTIIELLHDLYDLWPECPAKVIVADNAWDDAPLIRTCLVDYGIQLVARRTRTSRLEAKHPINRFDRESVSHFTGDGAAYCRKHNTLLVRTKCQFASRRGLKPGEPSNEHDFRVRYDCPKEDGCGGTRGLPMRMNWSALAPLPHSRNVGRAKDHAYRVALYARRNQCEAVNSALKVGKHLGLESADRTRTPFEPTVEALLSLSLMLKTAFVLADQRRRHGLHQETPLPPLGDAPSL